MVTIQEQIDWCKELHDNHVTWLGLIDDEVQKTSIDHTKGEIEILKQIMENLIAVRNNEYVDKVGIKEIFQKLENDEANHKGITLYWNCDAGRWHILPYLNLSIDNIGDVRKVLSFEMGWLKRWCSVEIDLKRKSK